MEPKIVRRQFKKFRRDFLDNSQPCTIIVEVRYDDRHGNGRNTFSIVGDVYTEMYVQPGQRVKHETGATLWLSRTGRNHNEVAKHFPHLEKYIKWHDCSNDGPFCYIANTVYFAGDLDYNGLRKNESKQIINGKSKLPVWKLEKLDTSLIYVDTQNQPADVVLTYQPLLRIGEGKEREFDAARETAIWPDATDEQLSLPKDELTKLLHDRLPILLQEFKHDLEELGFTY